MPIRRSQAYNAAVQDRLIELWNDPTYPTYYEMAQELGVERRSTVQYWLERLLKEGVIEPRPTLVEMRAKHDALAQKLKQRDREARQLRAEIDAIHALVKEKFGESLDTDLTGVLDSRRSAE